MKSAALLFSAPFLAQSLSVPGTTSKCCSCNENHGRAPLALSTARKTTVRASASSSFHSDIAIGRMSEYASLSDQWARIASAGSAKNEALERKLLGTGSPAKPDSSFEQSPSYANRKALTLYPSNERLVLVAAGAVMLASAIGLTMYLSGGIIGAASAGTSAIAIPIASAPSEKFTWLLRGGGTGYMTGLVSVGLLSIRQNISCNSLARYVWEMALPSTLTMTKKMVIMEIWRRVWLLVFGKMRKGWNVLSRGTANSWNKHVPLWIRLGFRNIFKSHVQKAVHLAIGQWFGGILSGGRNFYAEIVSSASTDSAGLEAAVGESNVIEAVIEGTPAFEGE